MSFSQRRFTRTLIGATVLAAGSAMVGYWFARPGVAHTTATLKSGGATEMRKPLYWYDPMQPNQHFDKAGKSPYMDMQLVPRFSDESGSDESTGIRVDPIVLQNLGVRIARVERGPLTWPTEAVGTIGFNQRNIAIIQARSNGFVTRVYSRAPGDEVHRGAAIVDLFMPEWTGAQVEFLALLQSGNRELAEAARERLRLLGMPRSLVTAVERSQAPQSTVTIRSPLTGVIEALDVRQGMTVATGAMLATINSLATVWLEASVPEAQGATARTGSSAEARLTAYPGQSFTGNVIAVLPQANIATHTLRIRVELANPDGKLKPGMFAQVRMQGGDETAVLFVPTEAVIRTGTRTVVIEAEERGQFTPAEVKVGADVGGKTVILDGLTDGQRIVVSGQFLIDSEASLQGVLSRFTGSKTDSASNQQSPGSRP
jgi:membrane fusion protein, copper/silver efflux system